MASIVFFTKTGMRSYSRVLKSAGHTVVYLRYTAFDDVAILSTRLFDDGIAVIEVNVTSEIPELVSALKSRTVEYESTPIVILCHSKKEIAPAPDPNIFISLKKGKDLVTAYRGCNVVSDIAFSK